MLVNAVVPSLLVGAHSPRANRIFRIVRRAQRYADVGRAGSSL